MNQKNTSETQPAINHSAISTTLTNKEKHFIDDDIFEQLLKIREEIYHKTEVNVSPRKLVNLLLKESDFTTLRDRLIQQYS